MSTRLLALACTALVAAAPAAAAQRSFTVTSFDRVRLEGPYKVNLKTGVPPFARASGSAAAIDGVSLDVQGRTLIIRPNASNWGGFPGESKGPVEISIGTHDLETVWVNGAGSLAIDKVRGQAFNLTIQGPGSVSLDQLSVDRLKLGMSGSGSVAMGGKAAMATAVLRGPASLSADALSVKDAVLGAEGTAVVKLAVTGTAKVDAQGLATVDLIGRPSCAVRAVGSATVNGCR